MPLDPLQERIAGGAAMIAHGFVTRKTKDIDLFTEIDDQEAIRIAGALRRALERQDSKHTTASDRP